LPNLCQIDATTGGHEVHGKATRSMSQSLGGNDDGRDPAAQAKSRQIAAKRLKFGC